VDAVGELTLGRVLDGRADADHDALAEPLEARASDRRGPRREPLESEPCSEMETTSFGRGQTILFGAPPMTNSIGGDSRR